MFANVDIDVGAPQNHVTLPQTAIAYNSYGNIVYLVDDKGKDDKGQPQLVARQTFVDDRRDPRRPGRGPRAASRTATSSSPPARSSCATARRSSINNAVQPPNDANPKPAERLSRPR